MSQQLLRYEISNWDQITNCLSNNSKALSLSLSKVIDGNAMRGLVVKVNHANYGTLFAAMIKGSGQLLTDKDEEGQILPFLTTDEILKQIAKFGFIISYVERAHLNNETLVFLNNVKQLGFDKITRVQLETRNEYWAKAWTPKILVIKSQYNTDLLKFDCSLPIKNFNEKLANNWIMNVTDLDAENVTWDWVTYIANIIDIINENITPSKEFDPIKIDNRPFRIVGSYEDPEEDVEPDDSDPIEPEPSDPDPVVDPDPVDDPSDQNSDDNSNLDEPEGDIDNSDSEGGDTDGDEP